MYEIVDRREASRPTKKQIAPTKKRGATSKCPVIEISPIPKKPTARQSPHKRNPDPKQKKTPSKQPTPSHVVSTLPLVSSAGLETQSERETLNSRALIAEDPVLTHPPSNVDNGDDAIREEGLASVTQSSKTYIEINGESFIPDILKDIHRIVTGYWRGAYLNWNQVPEDVKNTWWEHFAMSVEQEHRKTDTELWLEAAGSSTSGRVFGIGYMGRKQVCQGSHSNSKLSLEVNNMKETVSELHMKNFEKDKEVENCKVEINTLKDQFAQMIELMKNNQQNSAPTDTTTPTDPTPEGGDV